MNFKSKGYSLAVLFLIIMPVQILLFQNCAKMQSGIKGSLNNSSFSSQTPVVTPPQVDPTVSPPAVNPPTNSDPLAQIPSSPGVVSDDQSENIQNLVQVGETVTSNPKAVIQLSSFSYKSANEILGSSYVIKTKDRVIYKYQHSDATTRTDFEVGETNMGYNHTYRMKMVIPSNNDYYFSYKNTSQMFNLPILFGINDPATESDAYAFYNSPGAVSRASAVSQLTPGQADQKSVGLYEDSSCNLNPDLYRSDWTFKNVVLNIVKNNRLLLRDNIELSMNGGAFQTYWGSTYIGINSATTLEFRLNESSIKIQINAGSDCADSTYKVISKNGLDISKDHVSISRKSYVHISGTNDYSPGLNKDIQKTYKFYNNYGYNINGTYSAP